MADVGARPPRFHCPTSLLYVLMELDEDSASLLLIDLHISAVFKQYENKQWSLCEPFGINLDTAYSRIAWQERESSCPDKRKCD